MKTSLTWLGRLIETPGGAEWQRLSDIYRPLIAGWAARAGVRPSDVDDVTQEVLIVVVRRVSEFEHQRPGAFRGWLRSILVLQLRKYFRTREDLGPRISLDAVSDPASPDSRLFDREHNHHVANRAMELVRRDFEVPTWEAFRRQVVEEQRAVDVAADLQTRKKVRLSPKHPLQIADVQAWFNEWQLELRCESGVRVIHDYLKKSLPDNFDFQQLLEMELKYSRQQPYLSLGRYVHFIAHKASGPNNSIEG